MLNIIKEDNIRETADDKTEEEFNNEYVFYVL